MRDALQLAGAGVLAGLLPAVGVTSLLASMLLGLTVADPITLIGSASTLLAAALAAAWVPTMRATRVDPVTALRRE